MPKKLLVTASSYEHIQKFHIPYLKQFREMGWVTHVAGAFMPREVDFADKAFNLPFNKHDKHAQNLKATLSLRKLIKEEKYDLVITHTSLGAFVTRLAVMTLRGRPRLIYMCHGYFFSDDMPWHKNLLLRSAERLTARVTDLLLTMNSYDYKAAVKHRYSKRIDHVPGIGIDFSSLDRVKPGDRERLRKQYSISENDTVLIYAAEFSTRKSQPALMDAMSYLPDNVVLVLPGVGKTFDECTAYAKKLDRRIIFPGYVNDIYAWYAMADIAVTSARTEGLPFNVMEAMYMKLPVVASAVKGHVDLIEDGKTGLLFPYGDSHACARQIQKIIENPDLGKDLANHAKLTLGKFRLENVMPMVMDLYKTLM
jgi:glycosyltransferase EpsD